jgi:predicted DNA-binding transcriptional regulator AlpA
MTKKTSLDERIPRFASPAVAPVAQSAPADQPATASAILLMTAKDISTQLRISRSHWHQLVAEGQAPRPAIQQPRFTRWRAADVLAWVDRKQARG